MLKLCSEIIIEGDKTWKFNAVADCKIVEDVSTLTDTCEIQLPKKIKWQEAVSKIYRFYPLGRCKSTDNDKMRRWYVYFKVSQGKTKSF